MNFRVLVLLLLGAVASHSSPYLKWSPVESKVAFEDEHYFNFDVDNEWMHFRNTYKRAFNLLGQEEVRKEVFERNLRTIKLHNLRHSRGLSTFKMAVNEFADLTFEEYSKLMLSTTKMNKISRSGSTFMKPLNVDKLPDEVDWRKQGYVTPVKNQGQCGSCWAFSSVGAIEGQHFRKTGKLVSLSEQNLVDCSFSFGNRGCHGGLMDQAFDYVKNNSGIDTEDSYPYVAYEQKCRFNKEEVGATVSGHVDIEPNEYKLQEALSTVGPVSVAINAGVQSFRFYSEGVYDEYECDPEGPNHGVLAVGYGSENGKDYWLVKNSWGESWGIGGYVKMSRNKSNQCGIASAASYPLV